MTQVSYGTITITDTNDINRIYVEYCRSISNQLSGTTVPNITRAWGETTPPWVDGEYIWQRAVVEKSGTLEKTYGTPVCISGEKGETGQQGPQGGTGAAGRSLKSTKTQYTTAAANATITQSNMGSYTWSDNVPTYNANAPAYWVRITNTYENPTETLYIIYKDNGITDAVKTSADANATASAANTTAGEAKTQAAAADGKADTAIGTANTANTNATNALNIATGINQHFWTISTDYATGVPAGSYITDTAIDTFKSNKTGGNLLTRSDGIWIRNGVNTLTSLTGTALTFYNPTDNKAQLIIGANGILQSGNFVYTSGTYSDSGTKIDLTNGSIYTPGFRTDGSNTYIRGEINALTGKIGNNSTNYWTIGNNYNYDQTASAALISHGTAFIQLNESNTWRLSTDRIHTAWNGTDGSAALAFPKDGNTYWDWGMHSPHKTNNVWKDKFIYARKYTNTTDDDFTNRDNLSNDIDDDLGFWTYQFYIDKNGSIYARNFYLLNEDGTPGSNIGGQDAVYLLKSGGTISGNLEVNGTLTKGSKNVAYLSTIPTSGQVLVADGTAGGIKTSGYTIAKSVPSNAVFTDENVNTSQANTTQIYLTGTSTAGSSTGKLKFDSNVYLTTTAGVLHATTFEGNLSGTASRATADGDGNTIKTTYLKLSGGNVTGAVTFGSSVSADELTVGDLVVNGSASFTNNLQANTINGVTVGSSPKFTDTVTTVTVTGNGNAITGASASNGAVTLTKGATFLTSYTETDPIFVASAAHSITSNDISNWNSKTSNTGTVTSVRVQASSPLTSTTSTASNTTLDTTIKFSNQNKNLVLAGPSSGDAAAPTFRSLVAADIPGLAWSKITSGKPTTLSGYGITDAVPSSRKVAGHALTSDVTISNSDVGLGNVINAKQITNITNEFKDGQNTGKLVIWRGESDFEVLEVQITAREATSATNATNAQYATYDASEASKTTKTTIADKYIAKSVGTKKGDIIYWSGSGTPVRLEAGTNGHFLKLVNGVPTWGTDNNDNTWRAIQVNGTDILGTGTNTNKLNLKAGSNVTISNNNGTVTIASSYTNTDTLVTQTNTTGNADYRLLFSENANDTTSTETARKSTYLKFNPSSGLLKTYGISSASGSTPVIYSDVSATEIKAADSSLTTSSSDSDWLKALLIALCNKYPGKTGCIFKGTMSPNSVGWYEVHIYSTSTKDSTTGLPQYSFGRFLKYINNYELFGTASYSYSYRTVDTNTWNPLTTSQAGYVSTAPNDTAKFLRGDATWAQVSSANLSDIRLTWSSSVSTTDWILAHDTAATGTPLFRAMSPANLKTTMSLNNVENTALSTWGGSSNIKTVGTITSGTWNGSAIPVANGGTGATSAANARTNLGLGSAATYTASTSVGNNSNLPTGAAIQTYVTNAISGASNTYVTIATDQTITANQKTFNGAIRWGTSSKYGAAHYDSTLEAIVFSFA